MTLGKARALMVILALLALGLLILSFQAEWVAWTRWVSAALLVAGWVVALLFDHCPHCGRYLGWPDTGFGNYCRHCGKRLD